MPWSNLVFPQAPYRFMPKDKTGSRESCGEERRKNRGGSYTSTLADQGLDSSPAVTVSVVC